MRHVGLPILVFSLSLSAVADPYSEKALSVIQDSKSTFNLLNPATNGCGSEGSTAPHTASTRSTPDGIDPCTDLFDAACGANSKRNSSDAPTKLFNELIKPIRDARNQTAKAMGYADFDTGLKAKLTEAGIELVEAPNMEAWNTLKKESNPVDPYKAVDGNLYRLPVECEKEAAAIPYPSSTDLPNAQAFAAKLKSFNAKYIASEIQFYAKDIPNFMQSGIGMQCTILKMSPKNYPAKTNAAAVQQCANYAEIRHEAAELYRQEDSPGYAEKAIAFVKAHLPHALNYASPREQFSAPTAPLPKQSDLDLLNEKNTSAFSHMATTCSDLKNSETNAATKVAQDFLKQVNVGKPTVEKMISTVYSPEKREAVTKLFNGSKETIQSLLKDLVKDEGKRKEITDGYTALPLNWMEKPADSKYLTRKDGVQALDIDKEPETLTTMSMVDPMTVFAEPSLSFFTIPNAMYNPKTTMGNVVVGEGVTIMPALFANVETNPNAALSVIAHEAGHTLGPLLSLLNGYDLRANYTDLLSCFKSSESIKMRTEQQDETFADYVSAEVLAREIAKLPKASQSESVVTAMESFCLLEAMTTNAHSGGGKEDPHPDPYLRISGIFGGNPSLRKVMGCTGDSPNYKSCGLKCWAPDAAGGAQ